MTLDLEKVWQKTSHEPYWVNEKKKKKGLSLTEWFAPWLDMSDKELEKINRKFLPTMISWLLNTDRIKKARGGAIPTGYLSRFGLKDGEKFVFLDILMAKIIQILRMRGLVEEDRKSTKEFELLVKAFDRVH